jgi:hypothetical protein
VEILKWAYQRSIFRKSALQMRRGTKNVNHGLKHRMLSEKKRSSCDIGG